MILFENRAANVLYKVLSSIENKKFLLPLNVCPIVPDTFLKANKKFEFVDIDLDTLCIDKQLAIDKIKKDKTIDGILFVKTFGIELDTEQFYKKIKDINRDIFIIDDMCPSIQRFDYDIESSYADMALFSSGYAKFVDIGFGGYGFLKDENFSTIFQDKSNDIDFKQYKESISRKIEPTKVHKENLNSIYRKNLPKDIFLGKKFDNWRFSLLVNNKEFLLKKIFEVEGLFASSHYPQVDYNYVKSPAKDSNTKKIHSKILNLFNDFRFDQKKAYKVVEIINKNINKVNE